MHLPNLIPLAAMFTVLAACSTPTTPPETAADASQAGPPAAPADAGSGSIESAQPATAPPGSADADPARGTSFKVPETSMSQDPAPASDATAGMPGDASNCDAQAAQAFVGKEASADAIAQARDAAGAKAARVLKPGQMVTMEFSPDRLNIDVDASNTITSVRCG